MITRLRLLLAVVAVAAATQPASAFWWCHPCHPCHPHKHASGTGAPGNSVPSGAGINTNNLSPAAAFSFFSVPAPSAGFTLTPAPSASFTLTPSAGFTLNPAPGGQQQTPAPAPAPAPSGTNCATAADVQKISTDVQNLLNKRLGDLETKVSNIPTTALTEAKVREIIKAEVANEVKSQLASTNEQIKQLQGAVKELKDSSVTKKDLEPLNEALKKLLKKNGIE